ncbi:MAG: hypothetical protein ABSG68_15650 [Thermoguttaceae bacterium]|jgi:hypothetical protein
MNTMRISLAVLLCLGASFQAVPTAAEKRAPMLKMDDAKFNDWLSRWQKHVIDDARNRYCDKAMGEDIAWLMTPFMDGFYYGYMATRDAKWADIERLVATALAEKRYWDALAPYSAEIQAKFERSMRPESWGGLSAAPHYLMLQAH